MGPPAPVGEARGRLTASGSAAGEGDIQALVRNAAMATVCNLDGDGPSAPDAVRHDDGGEGESAKDSSHLDRVGAQFDGGGAGLDGPGDGRPLAAWPGGVISPRRDMAPITALVRSVRSWARSPAIPVCADGSAGYVRPSGPRSGGRPAACRGRGARSARPSGGRREAIARGDARHLGRSGSSRPDSTSSPRPRIGTGIPPFRATWRSDIHLVEEGAKKTVITPVIIYKPVRCIGR